MASPICPTKRASAKCGDAAPHGFLGDVGESLVLGVGGAHDDGAGGVGVPAVDDGAAVDLQHVAVLEHVLAREAVDHFFVDGGADGGREPVVALEVGLGAVAFQHRGEDGIDVGGGDADLRRRNGLVQGFGQNQAGFTHLEDLLVGFVLDFWLAESHGVCPFED